MVNFASREVRYMTNSTEVVVAAASCGMEVCMMHCNCGPVTNLTHSTTIFLNKGLNLNLLHIFFNLHSGGWSPNLVHSARRPLTGLLYLPRVIVRQGKPKYSEKTCPGATLSTTNPTWLDPGLNPGRRGGKPATNRFSYGAAPNPLHITAI
jgi:hypothetical protein